MNRRELLQGFLAVVWASVIASSFVGIGNAAASMRDLTAFQDASYIYIATVRKDGNQSRAARVWFIVTPDNKILIDTNSDSWKAKRIKRGSPALVWLGSATGPAFIGKAEIVEDKAIQDTMIEKIPEKYILARIGFFRSETCQVRRRADRDNKNLTRAQFTRWVRLLTGDTRTQAR